MHTVTVETLLPVREDIDARKQADRDRLLTAFLQRCWPTMDAQNS